MGNRPGPPNPTQFERLDKKLHALGEPGELRIGLEATGHYWIVLHEFLRDRGWQVEVFNPLLSAGRARTNLRGRKTDPDDALTHAKVVRDGAYTPMATASPVIGQMKALIRQRGFVVAQMANAKKRLSGLVDVLFPTFADHFSDPYGVTALAVLEAFPGALSLAGANLKSLDHLIRKASGGRLGREKAKTLREAARTSLARTISDPGKQYSAQMLIAQIRFSQQQIADLQSRISGLYASLDPVIDTIPGIGPVTGPSIVSEIGDIHRFAKHGNAANKLLAFAGADPRIRTSGNWRGKVKMTKRGSRSLRTALYQAAQAAVNSNPEFRAIYDKHRHERCKHHKVALSHVMRKLITVIYAVTRDNTPFDPEKIRPNGG
ncbi:MAG: IS110 family transposase [Planctomycetes bacterium]|nr:IS110 family transposase [Planctomycetota bacterium]